MSKPHKLTPCADPAPAQDDAFAVYWQGLLDSGEALRLYKDHHKMRGLTFGGFREAMADAFKAGKESTL